MTLLKILKVIGIIAIASVGTFVLLPWLFLAGDLIVLSFADNTDWRIE